MAALAETPNATGNRPVMGIEQIVLNALALAGADDPMDVATVLAVVEREQVEVPVASGSSAHRGAGRFGKAVDVNRVIHAHDLLNV